MRQQLGIRCKQVRQFKATTNSNHGLPVAANLLNQKFETTRPNEAGVTDITYVRTGEGWLYLAGVKATAAKRPAPGLIHHSDRGSQYCARDYRNLLEQFGMKASMSRRGNCYDNAPMESFWGTLKNERVHHRGYETRAQAIAEITEYIEIFYNRQRRHSRLGNLSPAAFTQQFYRQQQPA